KIPFLRQRAPYWAQDAERRFAFLALCRDALGIRYSNVASRRLDLWIDVMQSCGGWWPFEELCIISDRPRTLRWDDQGRLHHPSEAAVEFRDGFPLYMWHGTQVPDAWIVEPDRLDVRAALMWRNVEQRRAALEIIGWKRVLERVPTRTI